MERQLFVVAAEGWIAQGYRADGGSMDPSPPIVRDGIRAGLGDNLMSKACAAACKRMDECKPFELEQHIQKFANLHREHRGREVDFNLLSQKAERLGKGLGRRRKALQSGMN